MDKPQFIEFLEKNILTIFTGSEIAGEETSSPRDALVAIGSGGKVLIKFKKDDDYRIVVKKILPFKKFEIILIKSILAELLDMYEKDIVKSQSEAIQNYIIEKSICESLTENASETLMKIISELTKWGNRTYEGNRTKFGFIVTNKKAGQNINPNLHINSILQEDFLAVLSDGVNTCLEVSADGYLLKHYSVPELTNQHYSVPYEYLGMSKLTTANKIGISLCSTGDILVFRDKVLIYAKKSGFWIRYGHDEIIEKISDITDEQSDLTRKAIYLTALDTSFARTGGCVVHLDKSNEDNVLKHIDVSDILIESYYLEKSNRLQNESFFNLTPPTDNAILPYDKFLRKENSTKIANLRKVINGQKFYELSRKFRQELMGIDGATIVDHEGNIIAVGAIIMIESGGFSGGRLAAAKTLARYGVSIKISADGQIQGFKMDNHKLRAVPIFMLG